MNKKDYDKAMYYLDKIELEIIKIYLIINFNKDKKNEKINRE